MHPLGTDKFYTDISDSSPFVLRKTSFSFLPVVLFNFSDKKVVAIFPVVVIDLLELLS